MDIFGHPDVQMSEQVYILHEEFTQQKWPTKNCDSSEIL